MSVVFIYGKRFLTKVLDFYVVKILIHIIIASEHLNLVKKFSPNSNLSCSLLDFLEILIIYFTYFSKGKPSFILEQAHTPLLCLCILKIFLLCINFHIYSDVRLFLINILCNVQTIPITTILYFDYLLNKQIHLLYSYFSKLFSYSGSYLHLNFKNVLSD